MEAINDAIDRIAKKINVNVKKKATIAGSLNELANALGADKATGGNIYEALRNVNGVYSGSNGSGEGGDDLAGKSFVAFDDAVNMIPGFFANGAGKLITTANFPSYNDLIPTAAFQQCSLLTEVNIPACTSIAPVAFQSCSSLTEVNFPACTYIGNTAFQSCSSLTEANFPACTIISSCAFQFCSSLTTVNFPECTTIAASVFQSCSSLISANFPVCTSIGSFAFQYCSSLTSVNFPACTDIANQAFHNCYELSTANFPACTNIGSSAFYACFTLLSLYLTGSSICTLEHSDAFSGSPIGGLTTSTNGVYGSIYVPASLYESYKTAANWSFYSSRFVSVA